MIEAVKSTVYRGKLNMDWHTLHKKRIMEMLTKIDVDEKKRFQLSLLS